MEKIKAKLAKMRSSLSIKTYKRPMIFVILMMVFINLIILVIAALIAMTIDNSFTGFIDAFVNGSVKWMLTPNAILVVENPKTMVLAVIVLITGLVLFSGTIIALTTNAIKDYFQKKQSGGGKIFIDHHVVILNWNNKVPELVTDLLFLEESSVSIMILADVDKKTAERQITNAVKKVHSATCDISKLKILVKTGEPLLQQDLEDISIASASSILVMNKEMHDDIGNNLTKSDLNVIKIILNLGKISFLYNPPIVAEIKNIETKTKILTMLKVVESLQGKFVLPICFDRRLGQIIAQTIINNKIEDVYLSLFSFEGSEVYALENTTFDEALHQHTHAIPLGSDDKYVYVLTKNDKVKSIKAKETCKVEPLKAKKITEKAYVEVYLVGENNKLKFIMESFNEYQKLHDSSFVAKTYQHDDLVRMVDEINASEETATIVLLSDERQAVDALDANVIDALIYLEGNLKDKNINIIVELLDPKNDYIIKGFNIRNTIISNKIISLLLSKIALYKETSNFYEQLLTIAPSGQGKDDFAIVIKKASECFDAVFPLKFTSKQSFVSSSYEAFNKTMVVFGLFKANKLYIFEDNMYEFEDMIINADDECIIMKL